MNHTHSWQWALTKLLDGERLHWKHWGTRTWIAFNDYGLIIQYSEIRGMLNNMGNFRLSRDKIEESGWALYEPPPEAIRDEILFREFDLED